MRNIYILSAILFFALQAQAQTSAGIVLGANFKASKSQAVDNTFFIGGAFKKYLTSDINFVTGVNLRFYDVTLKSLPTNNDAISYYKDAHPNEFFHMSPGEYFRFSYVVIPVGFEIKLTTFMRLSYTLENNLLLSTNDTVEEYLQYGKKAAAPHMFTSNVAVLLHGGNAFGVAIGATLHPNFLRNDIRYTYEFMDQYKRTFRDSYMITISMWGDFAFKPRKRI